MVSRTAALAAQRGAKPSIVWHSGKLRARQTAETYWRACNALAEFSATRDIQPADPPAWMRDRLRGETRDILLVGHMPHLTGLLNLLTQHPDAPDAFPPHGFVAFQSDDDGETWREIWRIE